MKKLIAFLVLQILLVQANAQHSENSKYINLHLGYGTENNNGNTAFFGGVGVEKEWRKKFVLGAKATYFTTEIYNAYDNQFYDNEERFYNTLFVTPNIGFKLIGNNHSDAAMTLFAGPSLKLYDYKMFRSGMIKDYLDGRREPIESTIRWHEDKGINLSLYTGVSFDFKVSPRLKASLFVDGYSHKIWIEHFMPGVKIAYRY